MPTPEEIREELTGHHVAIRDLIRRIEEVEGTSELMEELYELVAAHNRREAELLEAMLAEIDAWGPVRLARMREHHDAERRCLEAELRRKDGEGSALYLEVLGSLLERLEREERHFLNATVLRDDVVSIGQSDG